jgi:phage baseplate assembly protein W
MASRVQYNINTLDLGKTKGMGIKLPFNRYNIFDINYTTTDQIKSNLLNFMLTNKGERLFNPNFGADIRNLLFEPNTDLSEFQASLITNISNNFPSITINSLNIIPDIDNSNVKFILNYSVNNQQDSLVIQIT